MTPAFPTAADCVIPYLLARNIEAHPDDVFATFASGEPQWTYRDLAAEVADLAGKLAAVGVRRDDPVVVWLPTGARALTAWLAISQLGAIFVPLNLGYRGGLLAHALGLVKARFVIAHPQLAERLSEIELSDDLTVILHEAADPLLKVRSVVLNDIEGDAGAGRPVDGIEPWHTHAVVFTSGTTGPSKAVPISYAQMYFSAYGHSIPPAREDRNLIHTPLFHVGSIGSVFRSVLMGGSCAVLEAFSTRTFWADVRRTGATRGSFMGSMAAFLLGQPVSEDEAQTPLRTVVLSPMDDNTVALARRIGADYYTAFNMSETSLPIISDRNPAKTGICGRVREGIQARIVDAHDREVAPGDIGELILRSDQPWSIAPEYLNMPEASATAWRNGWFHTGDAFRTDADGDYVFVDRLKDAIRRRGENISSYEVEREAIAHPLVSDAAAVATPSEHGDDEVLLVVETSASADLSPQALFDFLTPRMAHYMLPRFIRIVGELPRTPTLKIQKHVLRAEGVAGDVWDREAAGVRVRREQLRD